MGRLGELRTLFVAALLVSSAAAVAGGQTSTDQPPACPDTSYVEGIGMACQRDDGLLTLFDDEGNKLGTTHGPDPALDESGGESDGFPGYAPDAPVCDEDGPPHFQVLFVNAADTLGMTSEIESEIREEVGRANARVMQASSDADLEFVVHCEDGTMTIPATQMDIPDDQVDFDEIIDHLQDEGFDRQHVKYWIVYSGRGSMNFGGFGNLRADDSQTLHNDNNDEEPMYAVTFEPFRQGWNDRFAHTMLHEASHTMGAVQHTAPNFYDNRGGWHCDDELDVMCYGEDTRQVCTSQERYDCGKDDYFDATPWPGSYLDEHWNLAHPYNRFLEGCLEARGEMALTDAAPVEPGAGDVGGPFVSRDTVEVPEGCQSMPFALWGSSEQAVSLGLDVNVFGTGLESSQQGTLDALEICWYGEPLGDGVNLGRAFVPGPGDDDALPREPIRCDQSSRDDSSSLVLTATGTVPEDAVSASVMSVTSTATSGSVDYTLKAT